MANKVVYILTKYCCISLNAAGTMIIAVLKRVKRETERNTRRVVCEASFNKLHHVHVPSCSIYTVM